MDFTFRRLQLAFNTEGNRDLLPPLAQQYIRALERMLYNQSPDSDFGYVSEAGLLDARIAILAHTDVFEFTEYLESIYHEPTLLKNQYLHIINVNEKFDNDIDSEAIRLRRMLTEAKKEGYQHVAILNLTWRPWVDPELPVIPPSSFNISRQAKFIIRNLDQN